LRQQNNPNTQVTVTAQAQLSQYSGPIPDAESLARYAEVIPDAPERILKMAENQAEHRQWLEKRVITSDIRRADAGLICAFIITMTIVIFGGYIALYSNPLYGTIFTGLGLAGLAGTFIYGTQARREERLRRDTQNKALVRR
jgi:uncharacterized membrane protein